LIDSELLEFGRTKVYRSETENESCFFNLTSIFTVKFAALPLHITFTDFTTSLKWIEHISFGSS
jgi:hypothetical protein